MKETSQFIDLQKSLLKYKKHYYVLDEPLVSDYYYDMVEKKSYELAKELGFRADKASGAMEDEAHHVHWMVGYKEGSVYDNDDFLAEK